MPKNTKDATAETKQVSTGDKQGGEPGGQAAIAGASQRSTNIDHVVSMMTEARTESLRVSAGQKVMLDFPADKAAAFIDENNLFFSFDTDSDDQADSHIVLEGLVDSIASSDASNMPILIIDGIEVPADRLIEHIMALAKDTQEANGDDAGNAIGDPSSHHNNLGAIVGLLQTQESEGLFSDGDSFYGDEFGTTVDLLETQDGLDYVQAIFDELDEGGNLAVTDFDDSADSTLGSLSTLIDEDHSVSISGLTDGGGLSDATVKEEALKDGSNPSDDGETVTGTFSVFGDMASVTIGGKKVIAGGVQANQTSVTTAHGTLKILNFDPKTGQITYEYTLTRGGDHSGGGDVFDEVIVTVTDKDGDSDSQTLSIKIEDDLYDGPEVHSLPPTDLLKVNEITSLGMTGSESFKGYFDVTSWGSPHYALALASADNNSGLVRETGEKVNLYQAGNGDIEGRVGDENGDLVFALSVDSRGSVSLIQHLRLKHDPAGGEVSVDPGKISLVVTAAGRDGDRGSASLDISGTLSFVDGDEELGGDGVLYGGEGSDILRGGKGNDILYGGEGIDILRGGEGIDDLSGGEGNDVLLGGDGNDILRGGKGNDILRGGEGIDDLSGGEGNDVLLGGDGNDILRGGKGNDILRGGKGNDTLYGGKGIDDLRGGDGNDILYGGGSSGLLGGPGADTFVASKNSVDSSYGEGIDDFDVAEGDKLNVHDLLKDFNIKIDTNFDLRDYFSFDSNGPMSGGIFHFHEDGKARSSQGEDFAQILKIFNAGGVTDFLDLLDITPY